MEKIVLIEPQSKEDHVYKYVRMPRLGLPILGTQLQKEGYRVNFYLGTGDSLPWEEIMTADLVGISTTTATCREAYQIAGFLRVASIPVVIGGIHATFLPDEAIRFADYVVQGEAEESFLPLVRAIEKGEEPWKIPGLSYWENGTVVHNNIMPEKINMDTLPIPDITLLEHSDKLRSTPVMTSRGCPFNCTFCCVTQMFGRRYRFRCNESVLKELAQYPDKHIFFCDDNFVANKEHSKELMREMIRREDVKVRSWGAQVRAEAAFDKELLDLMCESGCTIVYIGFESINPETLKGYNKQQTVEEIREAINLFHERGIRIHGMFVLGGDADTAETIRETAEFAVEARIDTVQFMILTPMPGTPFFDQLEQEGRILSYDWSLYDGHHTVLEPLSMTPEELQRETVKALKEFYSLKNVFKNVKFTGWSSALYRALAWGLIRHFEWKNRGYEQFLKEQQQDDLQPVTLLERCLGMPKAKKKQLKAASEQLMVSLTEQKGVLYVKLSGMVSSFHLKELRKALRGRLPYPYGQIVINTEGVRFASEKAATRFGAYLQKLGSRVRRLQVVANAEKQVSSFVNLRKKSKKRLPRFELLVHKR
ncbi:MAG: B12-binding domain-containing radical SAM protein [Bacillota bacterium]